MNNFKTYQTQRENNNSLSRKTSAEIINEARLAIRESQNLEGNYSSASVKPLQTQRPFTPRDKERHLFGNGKSKSDRPPSSFSLRYLENETDLPVTPPSLENKTGLFNLALINKYRVEQQQKLINNNSSPNFSNNGGIFKIGVKEPTKVRLPSLETRPLQKRKFIFTTNNACLDKLPEEENEIFTQRNIPDSRNSPFNSPQERMDNNDSRSSTLSECLLLGPQNLTKLFDNKHIIEHSETLFNTTGLLNAQKLMHKKSDTNKRANSILAENHPRTIDDILHDLNKLDPQNFDIDIVKSLLEELYQFMETEGLLNGKIGSKMKIVILKSLYRFVDCKSEQVLINIAQIILGIKVTGNNLSGVCKLIFKISKNDENDSLFLKKDFLELFLDALGRLSPLDDAEACVYAYGAIKFLTMNSKLIKKILELGILPLMVLHVKLINSAKTDKLPLPKQTNHVLFQLTGALRNLVSEDNIYTSFIFCGTIPEICLALDLFSLDADITANISRTLSTISTNDVCCDALVQVNAIYKTFINLFKIYEENEEIIVRLTYTLGNIVAKIDDSRVKFFNEENSVQSLLNLWTTYLERNLQLCSLKLENNEIPNNSTEDVMIKIIRVIANIVINPDIGKALNESYGNKLIDEFLKVLISNPFKKNQELVLSILSTLNNLSYYYSSDLELDVFHIKQIDIAEGILEYTKSKNNECVIEAMRILGNLSRSKITRNYITETELFQILITLLDTEDFNLLKTIIGVFVNLMSDHKARKLFKRSGGVLKLITILKKYCLNDWLLGSLVCQVLWNYCIDTIDLYELFNEDEIHELLVLLADYLDDEKLFGIDESTAEMEIFVTQEYLIWEEFANVATNLLEKVEYFLDTFDQIEIIDDGIEKTTQTIKEATKTTHLSAW